MTCRSLISVRQLHDKLVSLKLLDGIRTTSLPPQTSVGATPQTSSGAATAPLRVCDATVASPDPASDYLDAHIPGAVFFDLNECADRTSGLTRTVPTPQVFEDYVNSLGIGASTEIVAYDCTPGFGGLFSAPRLWWLFRLFGYDSVRVLDGGFDQWRRGGDQYPIASSTTMPTPSSPNKDIFRAKFRPHLLKTFEQLQEQMELSGEVPNVSSSEANLIIDARGRRDHAAARLPSSRNLLFKLLVDPASGTLKSSDELVELFSDNVGVDLTSPGFKFVSQCVTGTTACSLNLALQVVAEEKGLDMQSAVYDGSIQEWLARDGVTESG